LEGSEKMPNKTIPALCVLFLLGATPALAHDNQRHGDDRWRGSSHHLHHPHKHHPHKQVHHHKRHHHQKAQHHAGRHKYRPAVAWHHGAHHVTPPRHPHKVHKQLHHHRRDDNWALYAIMALQLAELLNDSQRDSFAWAQQRAATAPLGDGIRWNDGAASGSVVVTREGSDRAGRYCREFQKWITIGGRSESGYGVACRQPDGAWQIVS